ncbi:MAG: hypothetical protein AAF328_08330 [Planctomycetota bacterium]
MPEPSADVGPLSPEAIEALIARTRGLAPIKSDNRSQVWRLDALPDSDVPALRSAWVLKRVAVPRWKTFAPAWLRLTPGQRQSWGGRLLAETNLRYAGPAAVVLRDLHKTEFTLVPWVSGETLDAWWPGATADARSAIAGSLGRLLGTLTASGLRNRDYKPTNLLVDAEAKQGALPVMIDLDGVGRGGSERDVVRSAAVLERALQRIDRVEPGERDAFVYGCCAAASELFAQHADRPAAFRRAVDDAHDARPLSYDPEPTHSSSEHLNP